MSNNTDIAEIQKHLTNVLDTTTLDDKKIAGVIGDSPSQYSKSPALWNAAFAALGIETVYLPLDVDEARLSELIQALKDSARFLGANVTVPHKGRIIEFLDELDVGAERIRAVNTIVRTPEGRLIGYNTDGEGFVESISTPQPGQNERFVKSLKGNDVLLLGAGGSARAVAIHVADLLDGGQLIICNRTVEHAQELAKEIRKMGTNATAITEEEISAWRPKAGLVINSTTKGQGGIRKLPEGRATNLEPYSSLAPAEPPVFMEAEYGRPDFQSKWLAAAQNDIDANNRISISVCQSIPQNVRCCDLIYHPEETVFLRHGRETGHRTLNGKSMIVCQAVIAFEKICKPDLLRLGKVAADTRRQLAEVMYAAW